MNKSNAHNESNIDSLCSDFNDHKFIFDNLDDIIWSISWPDLKVQFISKAVEDIIGYSVEEFKKDPLLLRKIIHPEDKKINERALENLKEKGYAEREIRIIAKNGDVKWVRDKGKMVYDRANKPLKVEGVMRDITRRKKAERKLKYNKNRYQTIFNSAPIGFMLEDEEGNILEVNEVMCEVSGYSKEELEGSNVLDKLVLPEYQELAKKNIQKLLQGKELEFDIKTPTKTDQIKYYHLKETDTTLPDGSKGIISMHLDITERKKLEKNLKENNVLLNSVLESIQDGIVVLNPDLTIRYTNPTIKKWFENQIPLSGKKCFMGFYNREDDCNDCPVLKSLKSGKMESKIKKMPAKFEIDFIEIFSYPIYNEQKDKITGIVEFVRDISERLKKEKEIKYLAYRDSLTGLYNRKFFEAEIERLDTKKQLPLSIIIGDLNGLKIINDSYGQKKGDNLLIKTANLLKEVIREEDVLARYGGDEFTILLPQTSKKTAQGLLNTLNAKSSETKEHAVRMTKLAFDFGEKMGLSNYELNRLSLLATLHDIGKTTIPANILKKPAELKDDEWELIKKHPERGSKIAAASEEFAAIADEIMSHHEKWDGSGYPDGLEKEDIPFLARIITIIDSYDVMTNDRPYSKAISKKEALLEIEGCGGSQFDPELAEKFVEFTKFQ